MPELHNGRVAVYLDFDNIVLSWYDRVHGRNSFGRDRHKIAEDPTQPGIAERLEAARIDVGAIIDYASSFGTLVLTRAYADWSAPINAEYRTQLVARAIDLVQLFPAAAYAKNGADIRLAVDAVEDMFRLDDLTHVVIVGGDSDYVPLAQRCKRLGRYVVGIGVAGSTAKSLTAACDEFASYDSLPGISLPELPKRGTKSTKSTKSTAGAGNVAGEGTAAGAEGAEGVSGESSEGDENRSTGRGARRRRGSRGSQPNRSSEADVKDETATEAAAADAAATGAGQNGADKGAVGKGAAGKDSSSKAGASKDGASKDSAGADAAAHDSAASGGSASTGTSKNGTGKTTASTRSGSGRRGAGKTGAGSTGNADKAGNAGTGAGTGAAAEGELDEVAAAVLAAEQLVGQALDDFDLPDDPHQASPAEAHHDALDDFDLWDDEDDEESDEDTDFAMTGLLIRALLIGQEKDDTGWLHTSVVKQQMRRMDPSFNEKALGFRSFNAFLKSRSEVAEVEETGHERLVRLRDQDDD